MAGWLCLGLFLQAWRNVQFGSSPLWYAAGLLAGGVVWALLRRLEQRWRRQA